MTEDQWRKWRVIDIIAGVGFTVYGVVIDDMVLTAIGAVGVVISWALKPERMARWFPHEEEVEDG